MRTRALVCAAVPVALVAVSAPANELGLQAVDAANIGIFAFRDSKGRPTAWPITPYRDGEKLAVTSTLAFVRKALHVHDDGRVALLAGGWHFRGRAVVLADVDGSDFERRFLQQEMRKYPPTADLARVPLHRWLFSWYFGRVIMQFVPEASEQRAGGDTATLITLDAAGFPRITPMAVPEWQADRFEVVPLDRAPLPDRGPAMVLVHLEPAPTDLRQLQLRGKMELGTFSVRQRSGSLAAPAPLTWWGQLKQQLEFHRRGREGRRLVQRWASVAESGMPVSAER
ncbi:MAG: hypothetical protein HY270_16155 [Deltaproteobacteria bacterium]|nr:hypothetical protein [Deltaproteobacteria bacterium]